jgi:hypothetical protein
MWHTFCFYQKQQQKLRSFFGGETNTMRNFKSILTTFGFALLLLALPTLASAQWRDDDDDNYGRNNRNDYRYLEQTIKRVKQDSKNFERQVERDRYNNYLENLAENFKEAADDLEDEFNRRNLNRSYDEAQQLVRAAEQIDRELGNNNRRGNNNGNYDNYVYNQWKNIQRDIKQIADAYNIRYKTNNGWWNRGGRGNGNGNGRIKDKIKNFPLPF